MTVGHVERFVAAMGKDPKTDRPAALDEDGFLILPASDVLLLDDLPDAGRYLALLGPGGVGKTEALKRLCAAEDGTWTELALLDRNGLVRELSGR